MLHIVNWLTSYILYWFSLIWILCLFYIPNFHSLGNPHCSQTTPSLIQYRKQTGQFIDNLHNILIVGQFSDNFYNILQCINNVYLCCLLTFHTYKWPRTIFKINQPGWYFESGTRLFMVVMTKSNQEQLQIKINILKVEQDCSWLLGLSQISIILN